MITLCIKRNTRKNRNLAVEACDVVEKRQRSRTLDLTDDEVKGHIQEARKNGYSADHGGGVVNSYKGFFPQSSAVLVVQDGEGFIITVGRGNAPRGPYGDVGKSLFPMLNCPWGDKEGRPERLLEWSRGRLPKPPPPPPPTRYEVLSAP